MSLHYRFPPAQAFQLNKCLFALKSNAAFRQRYAANAERALQEFQLTPEECAAVQLGDQDHLVTLGADPYLAFMASVRLDMDHSEQGSIAH
jgi:hypothetical protein